MAQRITRAKRKIAAANIPYRVPRDHELPGAAARGARRRLPRLHRGPPARLGRRRHPRRPVRRGDPARPGAARADARRARGRRAARPDAAHRRPSRRTAGCRGRARHARRAGPLAVGRREDRRGARAWCESACAATDPVTTSCWPRSTRCTPTPPTAADTDWGAGARAVRPAVRRDAHPGRRAQPGRGARGGARARHPPWPSSTGSTSTPTTRTTRPGPTCCAGWAGTARRSPPTTGRSGSRRTRPSGPCSAARRDALT